MQILLLASALQLGQCDPENIPLGLGIRSARVPTEAREIEVELYAFDIDIDLPAVWIAGFEWDPSVLRFDGLRLPPEILELPPPFHPYFLGPLKEGVPGSTGENPGCAAADYRLLTFGPNVYHPVDGEVVLAYLRFTVLRPADTVMDLLPRTPNNSQGISWPTAVWFCGDWRTFLPEDNRPLQPGQISFQEAFIRGDVDRNQEVELSDVIAILNALFLGVGRIACKPAADMDLSGAVSITDAVYLVTHLFRSGSPPPPPYPAPGFSRDGTGCKPDR